MDEPSDSYDRIAVYYDCEHETFREDIDFYLSHIGGGPVLEIGSGTGRVTSALASSGLEVVGVDPSAAMMERARVRLNGVDRATLVEGTIADVGTEPRFAAAVFTLNVLWHLTTQRDQLAALRHTHDRLVSGATLYLDLSNPLNLADRDDGGVVRRRFRGQCEGSDLDVTSVARDNRVEQRLALSITYDATGPDRVVRRTVADLLLRYTPLAELELMLQLAGFRVDAVFGSYDLDEYAEDSPNLLLIATAM